MKLPTDRVRSLVIAGSLLAVTACRTHAVTPPAEDPWAEAPCAGDAGGARDASVISASLAPGELIPGTIRAYGLLMPVGTTVAVEGERQRMFYVQAPMPAVMRYLQRRVDITTGEIHPLGAVIQNAHVRASTPGESFVVDLGVRDEGDRTLVTLWNRSQQPVPARSVDEGFRAAGFDPRTGRPTGSNNY
ncbi:MAG: hypothetical protein WCJ30_15995 [Deltaproteobacteria bacterium]